MTNHHDPIEAWLSKDVELLPPPQGTFQRVRRRARTRKAIQAAGVAAAAAVVVVAGVSLPELAGNLLSGPTSTNKVALETSPSSRFSTHHPPPASTQPGLPLSSAGTGTRPPAGFRPTSVTFINGGALGAVIGEAGRSCGALRCTAIAGTSNYGGRWTAIGSPPAGVARVSQVRFLDSQDGWAYGPALWVTRDGGRSWRPVRTVPPPVIDLATVSGRVFAVAATGCPRPTTAAGCTSFSLYMARASGGSWRQVTGGPERPSPGGLQLNASYGYLLAGGKLYAGPLSGGWVPVYVSAASPVTPPCLTSRSGHGLIAPTPTSSPTSGTLYLACTAADGRLPRLYASADAGGTWQTKGAIQVPGTAAATSLAVNPSGQLLLATTAGLYYSADARTWHRARLGAQVPGGFSFVGMTTASNGVAVPADAALHEVFVTRDGGLRWVRSVIR